ncbi:MAG: hypothetical protein WBA64_04690 [Marinomonas sp.]|uniref:hypothetical protein n=1 Tax=Marinomonas sp. TaxID=1904862 RepID=UPI003C763D88
MQLIANILKRIIFYGVLACIVVYFFEKYDLTIKGSVGFVIFIVLSGICALINSLNLVIVTKVTDIVKLEGLGVWATHRLRNRVLPRKKVAVFRAAVGIAFSLLGGLLAGYMRTLDDECVAPMLFGLTSSIIVLAIALVFLTLHEFYVLSVFESEMHQRENVRKSKSKALDSIRKDKTE